MMTMMMTTYFSEIKKNREEIRVSKFGGWGKNKLARIFTTDQ